VNAVLRWQAWVPIIGLVLGVAGSMLPATLATVSTVLVLVFVVLAAVYHAEVIAERVGEPYGTLILAVAVTIIEAALIISLMLGEDGPTPTLVRDTVFAAVMLIITGMVGICLLAGSLKNGEQVFTHRGVSASLATLTALSVLTLILPNFTTSAPGGAYSTSQLAFVGFVSLVLYGAFVFIQTIKHRDYFLDEIHEKIVAESAALSAGQQPVAHVERAPLGLTSFVRAIGAPAAAVGVFIAALVLLPESIAAFRAARANRLQTSMNLALGSALACIGLTIPTLAVISIAMGWTLDLGLGTKEIVLLALSLLVCTQSFSTGRTTVLQGTVHLVIFAVYLFTTIVP
jgi:Ca2+:H+ antiporter